MESGNDKKKIHPGIIKSWVGDYCRRLLADGKSFTAQVHPGC
jgi:hypothetical protein